MAGIPTKTTGRQWAFFKKVTVSGASFAATSDIVITFSTQSLMLLNEGSGIIEFSYNGTDVHGEMDPTKASVSLTFDNIVVCPIWFRLKSGSASIVSVYAWGIR